MNCKQLGVPLLALLVLPVGWARSADAQEDLSRAMPNESQFVECCATGTCFVQDSERPCPQDLDDAQPARADGVSPEFVAQVASENALSALAFRDLPQQPVTMRGLLAAALQSRRISHVFIGRIEGETPVFLGHPDARDDADPELMTWCQVRVLQPVRGPGSEGDLITVLYDGGSLAPDYVVWRFHAAQCLPMDEGIFVLYEHPRMPGLLRPSERATISFMPYAEQWADNPLTRLLMRLAAETGVRQ